MEIAECVSVTPQLYTMRHTILVPEQTRTRVADYLGSLRSGQSEAGNHLQGSLRGMDLKTLTEATFLDALINTKI